MFGSSVAFAGFFRHSYASSSGTKNIPKCRKTQGGGGIYIYIYIYFFFLFLLFFSSFIFFPLSKSDRAQTPPPLIFFFHCRHAQLVRKGVNSNKLHFMTKMKFLPCTITKLHIWQPLEAICFFLHNLVMVLTEINVNMHV